MYNYGLVDTSLRNKNYSNSLAYNNNKITNEYINKYAIIKNNAFELLNYVTENLETLCYYK